MKSRVNQRSGTARASGQKLSLKARAIALLAQREHSRQELERKLLRLAREQAQDLTPRQQPSAGLLGVTSKRGRASDVWAAAEAALDEHSLAHDLIPVEIAANVTGDADLGWDGDLGDVDESEARDTPAQAAERAETVRLLLDWLESQGYLSESRFIESRIHARTARYGNLRIQQELAQHGLSPDAEARQRLKDSELERARQVWQRKFDELPVDAAARAKQTRFLAGRGFSAEVIRKVLRCSEDD